MVLNPGVSCRLARDPLSHLKRTLRERLSMLELLEHVLAKSLLPLL